MPRGVKKIKRPSPNVSLRDSPGPLRPANKSYENDSLFTELDQRTRTLQLPAACSFVFGQIERYVRSKSTSHDASTSALPSKDTLLSLVDSHILKIPKPAESNTSRDILINTQWPFNVFEELELLDLLRVQIEERQSVEVQLALFDALFGLLERDRHQVEHSFRVMKKLVSLCISMGCTVVLQCLACWMEFYPVQSLDLSRHIYFEFSELLPDAMEPLMSLCTVSPSLARLLTYHLTIHYHIYSTNDKSLNNIHNLCPTLSLLTLLSHWLSSTPEYLFVQTMLVNTRDNSFLLRSQRPRSLTQSPLTGLVQWCVMEPLLSDECLGRIPSVDHKGAELVSELRPRFSQLHADILSGLMSLASSVNIVSLMSMEDLVQLVNNVAELMRLAKCGPDEVEKCMDRLAQLLQAGLSVGVIHANIESLVSLLSKLPQNRLMKLVLARQRNTPRTHK